MVHPYLAAFQQDLPYNVVLVELEKGPKMFSNIVGLPTDQITVGMPVEVVFEDVTDEFALPKFRPLTN
jgi:uncharacterized OB-fold protein